MTSDGPPSRHLHPVDPEPPEHPYDDQQRNGHRTPPQDTVAEQCCLGAMLISPAAIEDVTATLLPSDYYRPAHEQIHDAITRLHQAGQPVDMVTVGNELAQHRDHRGRTLLEQIGGAPYLHTLAAAVPIAANATYYAAIVRDKARLRALVDDGTKLMQLGYAGDLDQAERYLGDAVDHITETAMRFGTHTNTTTSTGLADLAWVLTGQRPRPTPPVYGQRKDGTALFYAGRHNGVFGDPESGKTWLAQIAGVEALSAGDSFAMVDVDHNGQDHTAARLALLGVPWETIADPDRFRYYEPEDADQLRAAIHEITRLAPAVTLIDSLGEILPMLGVKSVDNDEITAALRTVCMPPAKAGSCVISVDHLPKSAEARVTGFAIGGTAKKRAVDGSYLRVEAKIKPAPGGLGRVMLRIEKDRTGELRRTSGGGYAGTFVLDSTSDTDGPGSTTWAIGRDEIPKNDDGTLRPTGLMEKVATFIADNDGCSQRDIELNVPGKDRWVRDATKILAAEGFIARQPGPRRSTLHTLLIPYREAEDDHATPTE